MQESQKKSDMNIKGRVDDGLEQFI